MNDEQINLVRRSFGKISDEAFAESFYSHLFSIQPALRLLFPDDLNGQKEKLTQMLETTIEMLDEPEKLVPFLEESGRRHALYGAREEHYETMGAAFIASLRETSGGEFSAETEAAWTKLYETMSEIMKRGARQLTGATEQNQEKNTKENSMKIFNQAKIITGFIFLIFTFSASALAQTTENMPTLRGGEAVEKLKQTGQYDSLMQAVRDARQKDGLTDGGDTQDAVGQSAKLTASDGGSGDGFGTSVAISGETAIVGAPYDNLGSGANQGSAYIFIRSGTAWTQQAKLTAADGAAGDFFGISVAISGNTAVVSANLDTVGSNAAQGSVYVFTRAGTIWSQQAQLTAFDGEANDRFGFSVAISGDTVVVGNYFDTVGGNSQQGSAYVFVRSGTSWSQQQKLISSDGAVFDQFGISVAISGETIIIGAWRDDVGLNFQQGSAYVFTRSGTVWIEQQKLTSSDGAQGDNFGASVAINGETVIVGAAGDDVGSNSNQGSAYVFTHSGTLWSEQAKLTAADGAANDAFGRSVGIVGDMAVVGASSADVGENLQQGSVYVFTRTAAFWSAQQKITTSDGTTNDHFGWSVAVSGSTLLAGAFGNNVGQGSAYAFRVLSSVWTREAKKVAADGGAGDEFGNSIAISGDTAVVGAPLDNINANTDQGSAYVFIRSGLTWSQQAKLIAADGAADDHFGWSVAISGDTIVVSAIADTVSGNTNQGSAHVFVRSGTSWSEQQRLIASDGAPGDLFGKSVGISDDTIIVGAYGDNVGSTPDQGSAYIFTRSGAVWTEQQKLTAADGEQTDYFGWSVAISNDTAIVGASNDSIGGNVQQGSAYVFVRSGTVWSQQQKLIALDGGLVDHFGWSVGISDDTAIVGAVHGNVGSNSDQGSAYVFNRIGATWFHQQKLTATDGAAGDAFGVSVAISNDTVIVGASGSDVGSNANQGSAYVFERTGTTWLQKSKLTDGAGAMDDLFGASVGISGDKIVVGASQSDASASTPLADKTGDDVVSMVLDQGAALFFVNAPLAPGPASIPVGGRVFAENGGGLRNAIVYLTDQQGNVRTARTTSFGYYRFDNVETAQPVTISVISKSYQFAPQVVWVNEELPELNFFPQ